MGQVQTVGKTATTITSEEGAVVITYHWTPVVSFTPETVTLKTNGYHTATTKARMNQASNQFGLGYSVYQKNYGWYVTTRNGETLDFVEGMTFNR